MTNPWAKPNQLTNHFGFLDSFCENTTYQQKNLMPYDQIISRNKELNELKKKQVIYNFNQKYGDIYLESNYKS